MNRLKTLLACAAVSAALFTSVHAAPEVGQPAPDFTLTDINGQTHTLSSFKGKTVVLEWVNPECPVVIKHYEKSGNMPATQKVAQEQGVIWLAINSGHPGAQGDFDKAQVEAWSKKNGAAQTAYFRDQDGKVGKLYDARTTPHMFIINAEGVLVYAGGIDSIQGGNPDDIAKATNYVKAALADLQAGRPVATPAARPYGCSVKYRK
ncbi:MAG: thioredoxin family protein [Candidatus Didemnitutus sp.]|nr:thioredoxin family protein [Candidatus Didemnitutus sp.]